MNHFNVSFVPSLTVIMEENKPLLFLTVYFTALNFLTSTIYLATMAFTSN